MCAEPGLTRDAHTGVRPPFDAFFSGRLEGLRKSSRSRAGGRQGGRLLAAHPRAPSRRGRRTSPREGCANPIAHGEQSTSMVFFSVPVRHRSEGRNFRGIRAREDAKSNDCSDPPHACGLGSVLGAGAGAVVGAAVATTAAAACAPPPPPSTATVVVTSPPPAAASLLCSPTVVVQNNVTYYLCGTSYYMLAYGSSGPVYIPVAVPH